MNPWIAVGGLILTIAINLAIVSKWVGGRAQVVLRTAEDLKSHTDDIELLRKHATDLDRWIGRVDELLRAHDEEIDALRTRTHDTAEGMAINKEQISHNKANIERMRSDIDDMRKHLYALDRGTKR